MKETFSRMLARLQHIYHFFHFKAFKFTVKLNTVTIMVIYLNIGLEIIRQT